MLQYLESSATVASQMTSSSYVARDSMAPTVSTPPRATARPASESLNAASITNVNASRALPDVTHIDDDDV